MGCVHPRRSQGKPTYVAVGKNIIVLLRCTRKHCHSPNAAEKYKILFWFADFNLLRTIKLFGKQQIHFYRWFWDYFFANQECVLRNFRPFSVHARRNSGEGGPPPLPCLPTPNTAPPFPALSRCVSVRSEASFPVYKKRKKGLFFTWSSLSLSLSLLCSRVSFFSGEGAKGRERRKEGINDNCRWKIEIFTSTHKKEKCLFFNTCLIYFLANSVH